MIDGEAVVRPERAADEAAVRTVHQAAFPSDEESRIVDRLRARRSLVISLVAELENQVVGHVAFSTVTCDRRATDGLGLAPIAVVPEFQGRGIGSALIRAGLADCRERSVPFVVLLGDPGYYRRFGFVPASRYGLRCIYHDGDAFQAIELREGALGDHTGLVRYDDAFGGSDTG